MAIAVDTGKNRAKTGVRMVPNPNPENSVKPEATSALALMISMSIPNPVLRPGRASRAKH
jgi:hypothetical protein